MHRRTRLVVSALATVLAFAGAGSSPAAAQQDAAGALHADAHGDMTFALTGDAIISRALSPYQEPGFLRLRELIRGATAAYTNLEILLHDYEDDVIPAAQSGGTYMRGSQRMADELAWMGFDLVSTANNHTMDYGAGGMRRTLRAVERAGLVHAGAGENLALARMPGYLETPGGRVAIVSVASTFADAMRAGPQRKDMRGRPGLSPIRYRSWTELPRETFSRLAAVIEEERGLRGGVRGDTIVFMGDRFVAADAFRRRTRPHEGDLEEILAAIRDAKRQADWVLVSSHSHEGAESREVPAEFLVTFARAAIEAGADIFVAHGPHVLRGIEIHQGRPIFYSLANFIFQNETVLLQPADNYAPWGLGPEALPGEFQDVRIEGMGGGFPADPTYWETVLAVPEFRGGELTEVRLHPVTLGHGLPRSVRGRPLLATGELAGKILEDVRRLSEPFGTRLQVRDGIGVIRP